MDIKDRQDCELSFRRIEQLFDSGIFSSENARNLLQVSAFIELMICMRDLMHKCEKYATRISFTDDVLTNEYVSDATDAITAVRDACCHINSFKKLFDDHGNRGGYNVVYGKGAFARIGNLELRSDYDDDVGIFYGRNRVYLRRNIVRAFDEAKALLTPLIKECPVK